MYRSSLLSLQSLSRIAVRNASTGLVKTPIPVHGVDGRYISALWSAASKQKKLDVVDKDLKQLVEISQKDSKFQDLLYNPLIKAKQKKEILSKNIPSLKLNELTVNLVGVMAENGRIKHLPSVARGFNRVMAISRGELECTVTTAKPIDDATRQEIVQSLNGFVKGNKISLTLKVDPKIMGGMLVDFNSEHYIDMSIRSKFNFYSNLIKQAV
ncbi:ATP synthase subunit O, mitochondrial-like [Oppia nitens]|uniref:ATP synthase subunit O, mitochondrial-like n=1 Tax=Oppia nitens TaxID=1686743 RepID=UPI0023DCB1F4|nr:ATP synthase subunit O, mitochondrial-like [Oppia nitens]